MPIKNPHVRNEKIIEESKNAIFILMSFTQSGYTETVHCSS